MLFLAKFILKGHSQAALVAATTGILGLIIPPAAWISAAAIALVTLVSGGQRGLITAAFSLVGAAIFAFLIFSAPQLAIVYVLLAWLPALLVAAILRQTVSLAFSLQVLAALCLLAIVIIYTLYPDFGEYWREPLDQLVAQLVAQSNEFSLAEMKQTENWIIEFLPGLFVSSIMFGTMLSLFLARWWQAVLYNPGGFAREFQSLNLGKISALCGIAIMAIAMSGNSVFAIALVTIVSVLYGIQALSLLHAAIRIKQFSATWLFVIYLCLFFIPHLLLLLILISFADPWLDIRQRLTKTA